MTTSPEEDPLRAVRDHFDAYGEAEWERHVQSPRTRVALELHRRFLARFIRPGWRVLEIGAGPGRFTIELAALDAAVVVSDVSAAPHRLRGPGHIRRRRITRNTPGPAATSSIPSARKGHGLHSLVHC